MDRPSLEAPMDRRPRDLSLTTVWDHGGGRKETAPPKKLRANRFWKMMVGSFFQHDIFLFLFDMDAFSGSQNKRVWLARLPIAPGRYRACHSSRWSTQGFPFEDSANGWRGETKIRGESRTLLELVNPLQNAWNSGLVKRNWYVYYLHRYMYIIYIYHTFICDLSRKILAGLRWYWVASMGIRQSSLRANGRTKTSPWFGIADFFPTIPHKWWLQFRLKNLW